MPVGTGFGVNIRVYDDGPSDRLRDRKREKIGDDARESRQVAQSALYLKDVRSETYKSVVTFLILSAL